MRKIKTELLLISLVVFGIFSNILTAQKTQIRGFIEASTSFENDVLGFSFGEQDLFITSEITDNISFLGETVFKYSESSATKFNVSIERVIIKYNYKGNHNLSIGKHHTPINYWNDTYHHGRVFFPTIGRPILFEAHIIPIHTTGITFEGLNLGKLKFGYNLMIGNGIGSDEINDNDKRKSITAGVHIKPINDFRIGLSYYNDVISAGTEIHGGHITINEDVKQQLFTGSLAYFGPKFEVLAEGTFTNSKATVLGNANAFVSYLYAGVKVDEKWIPYVRIDNLSYEDDEFYFDNDNTTSIVAGIRYEVSYLAVVKLEYQHSDQEILGSTNKLTAQIAIGF